jgi:predicted nuclease of predicted toxin-antitoxin system
VRLLIDNALSPVVARELAQAGHDVVHVRDRGMAKSPDTAIMQRAVQEARVLVSADTDFGAILADTSAARPSVILLRRGVPRDPVKQARLLAANLAHLEEELQQGAVATFSEGRLRVRRLPISR